MGIAEFFFKLAERTFASKPPFPPSHPKLFLTWDDIASQATDAIVNAADWSMMGGTGVDGAIHEAAGRELGAFIVARRLRLETAQAVATPGFLLPAKHVIHTCAPVHQYPTDDDQRKALRLCYVHSIRLADSMGLCSISFPLLGGGAFGWPTREAATQCAAAIKAEQPLCASLKEIRVCAFGPASLDALSAALGVAGTISSAAQAGSLRYHAGKSATEHLSSDEILRRDPQGH